MGLVVGILHRHVHIFDVVEDVQLPFPRGRDSISSTSKLSVVFVFSFIASSHPGRDDVWAPEGALNPVRWRDLYREDRRRAMRPRGGPVITGGEAASRSGLGARGRITRVS